MNFIAIFIGKLIIYIGKILKRGSSMPGQIALKIDPSLLKKLKYPEKIIAVTGSSGKGSTSNIIATVYEKMGYNVVYNSSGANLTAGITSTLLQNCSMSGKIKGDILVYEMDERYAKFVFPHITPNCIVVTNITRDQPPRQGNFDLVYEEIKKALPLNSKIILNGDDPYLLKFNLNNEYNPVFYSINKDTYSYTENKFNNLNLIYCPKCHNKLNYEYYHFENLGKYSCPNCDFKNPNSTYVITSINYDNLKAVINNEYAISLQYDLLYSVYNTLAAFSALCEMGLDKNLVKKYISEIEVNPKMYNRYNYKKSKVYILNNKNENSTTFNQSLLFTERFEGTKTVVIGWKEISRRYNFDDLSWLYDIDFEILKSSNVENFVCVGPNAYDIAVRLKLAGFCNIKIFDNLELAKPFIDSVTTKYIFAILNFDYVEPFKACFKKEEV